MLTRCKNQRLQCLTPPLMYVEILRLRDATELNNDGMIKFVDVHYQTEPNLGWLKSRERTSRDHHNCGDWHRDHILYQGWTSRDLTTWHQIKQRCTIFMLHGISGLYELHLSVCTSLLRHLCVLLYTVLVFYDFFAKAWNIIGFGYRARWGVRGRRNAC